VRERKQLCLGHTNTIFYEKREGIPYTCLGEDPKIPYMRDLKGSYKESLSFI